MSFDLVTKKVKKNTFLVKTQCNIHPMPHFIDQQSKTNLDWSWMKSDHINDGTERFKNNFWPVLHRSG